MFYRLAEYAILALLALVVCTQMLWPLFKGRQMFPFFRSQQKLEKDLAAAKQAKLEGDLATQVEKIKPPTTK